MSLFWMVLLGTALLFAVTTLITILLLKAAPRIEDDESARPLKGLKAQGRERSAKVDWRRFDRVLMRRKNRDEETTVRRNR